MFLRMTLELRYAYQLVLFYFSTGFIFYKNFLCMAKRLNFILEIVILAKISPFYVLNQWFQKWHLPIIEFWVYKKYKNQFMPLPCPFTGPKMFSKFFESDQKFIYILCQSQTFCARPKDDLHLVKLVFVVAQKFLKRH